MKKVIKLIANILFVLNLVFILACLFSPEGLHFLYQNRIGVIVVTLILFGVAELLEDKETVY